MKPKTVHNTYYNINNDMEVIKPIAVQGGKSKPASNSDPVVNYGLVANNMTLIATLAGAAAGLLFSIITRKNYLLNIGVGAALGYAGNEFLVKKKPTTKKA